LVDPVPVGDVPVTVADGQKMSRAAIRAVAIATRRMARTAIQNGWT
jgi:hypothetical protein